MRRKKLGFVCVLIVGVCLTAGIGIAKQTKNKPPDKSESQIQKGYAIAPVPLDLKGKNPALVRLGSYYVNALGGCNDCLTCPSYSNDPYSNGPPAEINSENYLAGGVPFGPTIVSKTSPLTRRDCRQD